MVIQTSPDQVIATVSPLKAATNGLDPVWWMQLMRF